MIDPIRQHVKKLIAAASLAALLVPATALAGGGHGHKGERKAAMKAALEEVAAADPAAAETIEQMEALREWTRSQLKLARYHMENEAYAEAAARYDAVLQLEIDPAFESEVEAVFEKAKANAGDDGIFAGEDSAKKQGKKGKKGKRAKKGKRGEKRELRLYTQSARAHALAGDEALALQRLDEGIAAAQTAGADRAAEKLEALKADPTKLTKERKRDREIDPTDLETKIQDAESKLPLAP